MKKSELVERIHTQNPHLYRYHAEVIVNAILEEIVSAIGRGDRVELRGFGAFSARVRSPYAARNPKTQTDVLVPKKVVPYFKMGKEMRHRLNPTSEEPAGEGTGD